MEVSVLITIINIETKYWECSGGRDEIIMIKNEKMFRGLSLEDK